MKTCRKRIIFAGLTLFLAVFVWNSYGFADWQKEARIVGEAFKIIERDYLNPVDLTKCRYDILKALSHESLPPGDKKDPEISIKPRDKEFVCLDQFSGFMTPEEYKALMEESAGHFSGIGIEVKEREDGRVVVVAPKKGSPASKAGIIKGDIISKVRQENEAATVAVNGIADVVKMLRGLKGTKVFVTVEREGVLIDLPAITREDFKLETVEYSDITGDIGYVRLKEFNEESADDLEAALRSFKKFGKNPKVIIDLRENPGGLLGSVLETLYYFSDKQDDIVLTQKFKRGEEVYTIGSLYGYFFDQATKEVKPSGEFKNYKIVILINGLSASASEIFSGTMQDWMFTVIGTDTFGKGVGQRIYPLSDNSGLRLTTFEFLVGNSKTQIHKRGVLPDIKVEDTRKSPEDTLTDKDKQFKKALEILNQNIINFF